MVCLFELLNQIVLLCAVQLAVQTLFGSAHRWNSTGPHNTHTHEPEKLNEHKLKQNTLLNYLFNLASHTFPKCSLLEYSQH